VDVSEWKRIEGATNLILAMPVALALFGLWLVTKYLALATAGSFRWLNRRWRWWQRVA
jgi:hypothetical protein